MVLVTPRPPRCDGRGDQRRAWGIHQALSERWDVEVVSWLPDLDLPRRTRLVENPVALARALALATVRPLTVAYVQGLLPKHARRRLDGARAEEDGDGGNARTVVVFVTHRAVPRRLPPRSVVDFVDDLGASSRIRARATPGLPGLFWAVEGWRIRRLDRRLAVEAAVAVAHSPADSATISPRVRTVPLAYDTRPAPDIGSKVVFTGNLFYGPNHEAALWICNDLAPRLESLGIGARDIVIAGRQPRPALREAAARSGVDLRADVPDLATVYAEAAVVVAPMALGVGALNKTIDAIGAGRACVLSPLANQGLGLVDGQSALVRPREPGPTAEAVASLIHDPELRRRLADRAREALVAHHPDSVAAQWRAVVAEAMAAVPIPHP